MRNLLRYAISFLTIFSLVITSFVTSPQAYAVGEACPTPFTEYSTPTVNSAPHRMAIGGDGDIWFSELASGGKLGHITTAGIITEYQIPAPTAQIQGITAGPDGATWFTWYDSLGRITNDGTISQVQLGAGVRPGALTLGPDGAFWIGSTIPLGGNPFYPAILRVTTDGTITTYPIATTPDSPNGIVESITKGPDGAIWFVYKGNGDGTVNRIGRMDVSDGSISWFPLSGNYNEGSLGSIIAGPDGALWFTGYLAGGFIGHLTTSGELTQYTDSRLGGVPTDITIGEDGNLWFTHDSDGIGRITLNPFHIDLYHTQTTGQAATVRDIVAVDNALWFTEQSANKIGKLPLSSVPVVTTPEGLSAQNPTNVAPALNWQAVSGVSSYGICRDGIVLNTTNQTNFTDTNGLEGLHYYTLFATDTLGNNSSPALGADVFFDQTLPTLSVPTLSVNPLLSGQTSVLSVSASDSSGIQKVEYTLNGGSAKQMTRSGSTWRATFTSNRGLSTDIPDGVYTIVIKATDNVGNQSAPRTIQLTVGQVTPTPVPNVPPVVGTITASVNPIQVNSSTTATASFTDSNTADTHTAVWDWGDGMSSNGTVTESNGSGSVSDSHVYLAAGVYEITLTVTDNNNASDSKVFQYLSVYNPTPQGLFSGARIFTSPQGAYPQDPNLSGQVQFGITAKYDNTGSLMGDLDMHFKAAGLEFNSTGFSVLVTSNGKATLRGTGTINGTGSYTFLATGVDGANDTIRFQIKDGSTVIFDSQLGEADTVDPTASVTGQVIIH